MYWLLKSEPETFSIDDLARVKIEPWNGVRNYQARNFMRQMQSDEEAFFYHSNCAAPGIYGRMRIARTAYADPTQFDATSPYFDPKSTPANPRWSLVDVAFVEKFKTPILLSDLRTQSGLNDFILLHKGNRLSVMPVSSACWQQLMARA